MSRTLKDRPYWVLKNDPKAARYAVHDHLVPQKEIIGEEEYNVYSWRSDIPPVMKTRPVFRRWYETVPCTLDIPENGDSSIRYQRWQGANSNEEMLKLKNCEYYLEYYPNTRSNKDNKRLTNKALRHKVNVQLGQAERDFSQWLDSRDYLQELGVDATLEDIWEAQHIDPYAIDIVDESKYLSRGWWD